jgi:pilus assembly protein CpaB
MGLPRISGRRAGLWLTLAGAAGLMAVILTLRAASQAGDEGWALVAARPVPAGTMVDRELAASALALVAMPPGVPLKGVLTSPDDALGRRVVAHLSTGEPVTEAVLGGAPGTGPAPLAPGERAVAAPLTAAAGAASALAPGVRVDVVASTGEGLTGRTEVVVSDAEVLSVAPPASTGDGGEVLLRVSSGQALTVTAALNFAREVRLLVRPHDEADSAPPRAAAGAP